MNIKVEMVSQDTIEQYEDIARDFFQKILNMDYDACFVSDESTLSHFFMNGMPEGQIQEIESQVDTEGLDTEKAYEKVSLAMDKVWEPYMVKKVLNTYGIEIESTEIYFHDLFDKIYQVKYALKH